MKRFSFLFALLLLTTACAGTSTDKPADDQVVADPDSALSGVDYQEAWTSTFSVIENGGLGVSGVDSANKLAQGQVEFTEYTLGEEPGAITACSVSPARVYTHVSQEDVGGTTTYVARLSDKECVGDDDSAVIVGNFIENKWVKGADLMNDVQVIVGANETNSQ